jgi:hypothetical protein
MAGFGIPQGYADFMANAQSSQNDSVVKSNRYAEYDHLFPGQRIPADVFLDDVDGLTGQKEDLKRLILGSYQTNCLNVTSMELKQDTTGGYDSYTLYDKIHKEAVAVVVIIDGRGDFGDGELELEKVYRPRNNDKDKKKEEEIEDLRRLPEPPVYKPSEIPELEEPEPEKPDDDYGFEM